MSRNNKALSEKQKTIMRVEDLFWTLKNLDLEHLENAIEMMNVSLAKEKILDKDSKISSSSSNPNKNFLIGTLPNLLQNKEIFPQNNDIAEFAEYSLGITISRPDKRSRPEMIGMLVCATHDFDESKLMSLVKILEAMTSDTKNIDKVIEKKKSNSFSWNEAIQELMNKP